MLNHELTAVRNSLFALLMVSALAATHTTLAQSRALRVDIPFSFQTGLQHFPAGAYRIELTSQHMIRIRSEDSKYSSFVTTDPQVRSLASTDGKLVFHRIGSSLFLSEIWTPNMATGLRCTRSRAEHDALVAANAASQPGPAIAFSMPLTIR